MQKVKGKVLVSQTIKQKPSQNKPLTPIAAMMNLA
jgi:hypothetical protein